MRKRNVIQGICADYSFDHTRLIAFSCWVPILGDRRTMQLLSHRSGALILIRRESKTGKVSLIDAGFACTNRWLPKNAHKAEDKWEISVEYLRSGIEQNCDIKRRNRKCALKSRPRSDS